MAYRTCLVLPSHVPGAVAGFQRLFLVDPSPIGSRGAVRFPPQNSFCSITWSPFFLLSVTAQRFLWARLAFSSFFSFERVPHFFLFIPARFALDVLGSTPRAVCFFFFWARVPLLPSMTRYLFFCPLLWQGAPLWVVGWSPEDRGPRISPSPVQGLIPYFFPSLFPQSVDLSTVLTRFFFLCPVFFLVFLCPLFRGLSPFFTSGGPFSTLFVLPRVQGFPLQVSCLLPGSWRLIFELFFCLGPPLLGQDLPSISHIFFPHVLLDVKPGAHVALFCSCHLVFLPLPLVGSGSSPPL